MKKIAVILILFLFLLGAEGCTPPGAVQGIGSKIKGRISGGEEIVRLRGLSVEFVKGKPHLSSKEGEKLPIFRAGSYSDVGLKISNYMLRPVSGDIKIYNLARYAGGVSGEQSFGADEAVLQDGVLYPGEEIIEFSGFDYDKDKIGDGLKDSLITEVSINYDASISADLCFSSEEEQIIACNNDEILTENVLKGDAGYLPVSINKIIKEVVLRDGEAEYYLIVKLRNFGDGDIEDFSFSGAGCGSDVKFRDGKAEVECKGSVSLGDELFIKEPMDFSLSYKYEVIRTISYKVI